MQNNNSLISFLQAFGILLVVVGHSHYGCPVKLPVITWIYSFHMPLFMFISGYLLRYGIEIKRLPLSDIPLYGEKGFIVKKVKRLLIPYVVISSIALVPKSLLGRFAARPIELSFMEYGKMLLYPWDNVIIYFWFLPTLFLIFLIVIYGARILGNRTYPALHLILFISLLLLHLFNPFKEIRLLNADGVASYLLYFSMGYYACREQIAQKMSGNILLLFAITFSLSIYLISVPHFFGKDVLTAANGIAMSLYLGMIYQRYNWRFLHHLFGASYAIYLFSWFPQVLSQQVFLKLTGAPWQVGSCLAILSGVYIPLWIYKWIIRSKDNKLGKIIALLTGQS